MTGETVKDELEMPPISKTEEKPEAEDGDGDGSEEENDKVQEV